MRNASSLGSGNQKSINVEANLLDAWMSDRRTLEEQLRRSLVLAVLLVVALSTIGPLLAAAIRSASASALAAAVVAKKQANAARQLTNEAKRNDPSLAKQKMLDDSNAKVNALVGSCTTFLNAVPSDVVLNQLHLEMLGGDLTLHCTADATHEGDARAMVRIEQSNPGATSVLMASERPSASLGDEGVTFEVVAQEAISQ